MGQQSILITGCSSGIGRCAALTLRDRGWQVLATVRRQADVEPLAAEGVAVQRLDLAEPDSIEAGVAWALRQTGGRLDALFNNGAYGQPGAVEDLPVAALRAQFEVNLFGWHDLTRRVLPVMRAQGAGRIVQNSSILGFIALPYRGAYVASKFALEGLTDALRLELAGSGIHVALVEPGPVITRFRANSLQAFARWIDVQHSPHATAYAKLQAQRLAEQPTPYSVPPEAVVKRLIHALESPRPRLRYPVTFPTHLFAVLKRLLPAAALDQLLRRV